MLFLDDRKSQALAIRGAGGNTTVVVITGLIGCMSVIFGLVVCLIAISISLSSCFVIASSRGSLRYALHS